MATEVTRASAYLVVKASRYRYGPINRDTGLRGIEESKITQARQSRPPKLGPDEILIKVSVRLPVSVFDPIVPQALVIVPEDLVLARHEIEVTADEDPEVAAP